MIRRRAACPVAFALLAFLAACRGEVPAPAPPTVAPGADVHAAGTRDGVPGTAPADADKDMAPPGGGVGLPAPGTIRFDGFGPAAFGSDAEALRIAWGQDLGSVDAVATGACHHLYPQPRPDGPSRIAFMIDDDRFVRIEVAAPDILAPGGGRVGMDATEIDTIYPGRVSRSPHEYSDGAYLRVPDAAGDGVLVFETDAQGKVVAWRVGLPPQVDYVEGCS